MNPAEHAELLARIDERINNISVTVKDLSKKVNNIEYILINVNNGIVFTVKKNADYINILKKTHGKIIFTIISLVVVTIGGWISFIFSDIFKRAIKYMIGG